MLPNCHSLTTTQVLRLTHFDCCSALYFTTPHDLQALLLSVIASTLFLTRACTVISASLCIMILVRIRYDRNCDSVTRL